MKRALFIFRRDLRLEDNTALLFALTHSNEVILSFIFTPEQIHHNPFRSDSCLQFMIESLEDLNHQIQSKKGRLFLFFDKPESVISNCISSLKIDGVIFNKDYTPYSLERDKKIEALCKKHQIEFHSFEDALLHAPSDTLKSDGKPYTVFTPFYRNALKLEVKAPIINHHHQYYTKSIPFAVSSSIYHEILPNRRQQQKGGRSECLNILKKIANLKDYESLRDFPAENYTSHLSAHLKFTTCSIREVFHALHSHFDVNCELIRSLYWRDFFTSIAFHFPHVFEGPFKTKFEHIKWGYDKKTFKKWCDGETGFPIVDAGMRQLNQTGFMHNRVRLLTACFLIKDLHIDWRWGEKYFAQKLIDYDPCVNNGNWQWVASTGCDAQPYFRIFNPWTQAAKFDPDCLYIKQWIPELNQFTPKIIHKWFLEKNYSQSTYYPTPIVDHSKEAKKAINLYR